MLIFIKISKWKSKVLTLIVRRVTLKYVIICDKGGND